MRTRMDRFYPYLAGMSLGLALLTKSTAYLLGLPFLLWFVVQRARADRWLAWKPLCIVAVMALALNLGLYQRNTNSFGHPLNPGHVDMFNVINETISPPTFVSNAVRNIALHGVLPSHHLRGVVWGLESAVRGLHHRLGIDVNDPKTTQEGTAFQLTTLRALHEDTAGNPLHLMLIGLCTIMFLGLCLQKQWRLLTSYFICVLMGFLLIILYLKWSPWHSRFHLASFMLWSPFVGLMLSTGLNRTMANSVAVLLLVAAVPWVVLNNTRPLLRLGDGARSIIRSNRISDYFRNSSDREAPFRGAAEIVQTQRCSQIGLDTGNNEDEYQLWVLLKKGTGDRVRIEHVNTPGYARALPAHFYQFRPCAIISVHSGDSGENIRILSGPDVYRRVWWAYPVGVFVRGES